MENEGETPPAIHQETKEAVSIVKTAPRQFKCDHCSYVTKKKYYLEKHYIQQHSRITDSQWYKCAHCTNLFKRDRFLKEHIRLKHAPEVEQALQCPHCDFKATSSTSYERHQQNKHSNGGKFNCNFCFHSTKSKQRLEDHVKKKHSGAQVQRFQCKHCRYQSNWKQDLVSHKCHTSENFALVLIKGEPQDIDDERLYERLDEFKFVCESCEYKTNSKGEMDKHILNQHTDLDKIKWYTCSKCCFKSKLKSNLKKHYTAKHAEDVEWMQCPQCAYKAKTRDLYTKHLKIHADYFKSYQCELCSYSSARKYGLDRHVLAKHNNFDKKGLKSGRVKP